MKDDSRIRRTVALLCLEETPKWETLSTPEEARRTPQLASLVENFYGIVIKCNLCEKSMIVGVPRGSYVEVAEACCRECWKKDEV